MNATMLEQVEADVNPSQIDDPMEENWDDLKLALPPEPPRGRRWSVIGVAVLVCAGGVGWYVHNQLAADGGASSPGEQSSRRADKAVPGLASNSGMTGDKKTAMAKRVETVPVDVVERSDVLRLTGSLIADETSSVASNASGIAAEVLVDRGSVVRKNDVLVQIDPTDAKNKLVEGQAMLEELKARLGLDGDMEKFNPEDQPEVRLAKASADLAAANLQRAKEMVSKKVVSTESYDQTRTEYELASQRYRQALLLIKQAYRACQTAMAKLAILEKAVADTTIRAPFDGWVAEKLVSVGEQINSGAQATKVVTLVRIDPLRLALTVPQQDVGCVHPGQKVQFRVDSYPDHTFEGTVQYITPVVANDTRSMVVEAVVPNPDGELRPGMFATAELFLSEKSANVYVPVSAIEKTGVSTATIGRVKRCLNYGAGGYRLVLDRMKSEEKRP